MEYNGEYQFTEPGEELQELFDKVDALPNKEELDAELEDIRTGKTMRDGSISWDNLDHNVQNIIETSGEGGGGFSTTWGNSERLGITQKKLTEEHEAVGERFADDERYLRDNYYQKGQVYTKGETYNKQQLDSMITTPEQQYVTLTAEVDSTLESIFDGVEGAADTTYRVGCWDGEAYNVNSFSEYAYDGMDFVLLSVQTTGIDAVPTQGSHKLVESGGVYDFRDPAPETKDNAIDLSLVDNEGKGLAYFRDGNIILKDFDSRESTASKKTKLRKDLIIEDKNGNALMVLSDGHVVTKNFDSRNIPDVGGVAVNQWFGKSICFLGDSIIEQQYVIDAVAKMLGCEVYNRGWSGSMVTPTQALYISTQTSGGNVYHEAFAFTDRCDWTEENRKGGHGGGYRYINRAGMPSPDLIDLVVIHGGANDYAHGDGSGKLGEDETLRYHDIIDLGSEEQAMSNALTNHQPGAAEPVQGASFAAALKYTCYKVRMKYPHIPVALCTIFSSYTYKANPPYHTMGVINSETMAMSPVSKVFNDNQSVTKEMLNNIIRSVAKQFGFYCIEMDKYSACGINQDFADLNFQNGDMVHPSEPYGAWNYGVYMANQILDIPYYDKSLLAPEETDEQD